MDRDSNRDAERRRESISPTYTGDAALGNGIGPASFEPRAETGRKTTLFVPRLGGCGVFGQAPRSAATTRWGGRKRKPRSLALGQSSGALCDGAIRAG